MASADDLEILIKGTKSGLGIRIVGGKRPDSKQESDFGIFVKEVIPGSLAERDGRLKRGDQLLKANGVSLVGVSNERGVEVLKSCAKTDEIAFVVSRSSKAQSDFRRLSDYLTLDKVSDNPVATSTPRSAGAEPKERHHNTSADGTEQRNHTRSSSASSELTQISTTDISSHGDRDDDYEEKIDLTHRDVSETSQKYTTSMVSSGSGSGHSRELTAKLSDVEVSLEGVVNLTRSRSNSDPPPPPLPSSPPPSLDDTSGYIPLDERLISPKKRQPTPQEKSMATAGSAIAEKIRRSKSPPERKVASPPTVAQSAVLPSPTGTAPSVHSFTIPKRMGLGIILGGGLDREGGPHVYVERMLAGMDAAKNGQLKSGDRLISVNGESFVNIKREKALTVLTQLKIKKEVKSYTVVIERSSEQEREDSSPLNSLPQPPRTTAASIFDSDTIVVSDHPKRPSESPARELPKVSDLKHTPQHKTAWLGEEGGGGTKSVTPHRYLSKKESYLRTNSLHKRLSMDPSTRVKLSKLEWALEYMGYMITPEQKEKIHSNIDIDGEGRVVFLEFVKLAKEIFAFHLDDIRLEDNLVYALIQKEPGLDLPIFPKKATSYDQLWREHSALLSDLKSTASHPVLPRAPSSEMELTMKEQELEEMRQKLHVLGEQKDMERLAAAADARALKLEKENKKLKAHIEILKQTLKQKDKEIMNTSTDSNKEALIFKKRAELAEVAAKSSRDKANDLEDSVRRMEAELSVLKEEHSNLSNEELRRRLAAVDCQMRKEKKTVRRYEVATEKLLQFVENCHEALVKSPEADRILYHPHGRGETVQRGNAVTGNPRPPQYLSRHAKVTATSLAQEAQETITAVRKVLLVETLPFGWEEAYTEDGRKYFINHESQTTSWVHPVTNVSMAQGGDSRQSTPISRSLTSSHTSLIGHTGPPRPNQQA